MVKGAWWHSAHCLFCFQARLSFARKVSPRLIVPLTSGAGAAAAAAVGRRIRLTMAERRRMADLQARVARIDKQAGGRGEGSRLILPARQAGCQRTARFLRVAFQPGAITPHGDVGSPE